MADAKIEYVEVECPACEGSGVFYDPERDGAENGKPCRGCRGNGRKKLRVMPPFVTRKTRTDVKRVFVDGKLMPYDEWREKFKDDGREASLYHSWC